MSSAVSHRGGWDFSFRQHLRFVVSIVLPTLGKGRASPARGPNPFSFSLRRKRKRFWMPKEKEGAGIVPAYANSSAARRTGLRQQVAAPGGTTYVPNAPPTLLTTAAAASGVWLGAWVVLAWEASAAERRGPSSGLLRAANQVPRGGHGGC